MTVVLLLGIACRQQQYNHNHKKTNNFLIHYYIYNLSPQQCLLGFLHSLEMEIGEDGIEELLNLVVHEISNTALMSVMDILVGHEIASLDIQAHLLVGIGMAFRWRQGG